MWETHHMTFRSSAPADDGLTMQQIALSDLKCKLVHCQTAYPALSNFNENHSMTIKGGGNL